MLSKFIDYDGVYRLMPTLSMKRYDRSLLIERIEHNNNNYYYSRLALNFCS